MIDIAKMPRVEQIKYRLSNIGENIGEVALEYIIELEKENAELKEQIEKMKNVGNCKHSMTCAEWNEKQCNLGLMKFCLNCKDWELADD